MTQPTPTVAVSALELAQHLEGFKSSSHTLEDGTPLHLAAARELRRLAELDRLAAVPEGWKLVPIEPTPEMLQAAVRMREGPAVYKNVSDKGIRTCEADAADDWDAMLAAAPSLPQSATKEQTA